MDAKADVKMTAVHREMNRLLVVVEDLQKASSDLLSRIAPLLHSDGPEPTGKGEEAPEDNCDHSTALINIRKDIEGVRNTLRNAIRRIEI